MVLVLTACQDKKQKKLTPWGTPVEEYTDEVREAGTEDGGTQFSLADIQANGELIMLTLTGPETYYDYHGHGMGL